MKVTFQIQYKTSWGEQLCILGSAKKLGKWNHDKKVVLTTKDGELWKASVEIEEGEFDYKYFVWNEDTQAEAWEYGKNRRVNVEAESISKLHLHDSWRLSKHLQNVYDLSPFKKAYFKHTIEEIKHKPKGKGPHFLFSLRLPRVPKGKGVCLVGSDTQMGAWDEQKKLPLHCTEYGVWEVLTSLDSAENSHYKYALYDKKTGEIETWEGGENRTVPQNEKRKPKSITIIHDEYFADEVGLWKAAGVALPVFALKTEHSGGVGEFKDLMPLVDWAADTGLKMIQILPINDTVSTKTWVDSYPYGAISVFALHPMFLRITDVGELKDSREQSAMEKELQALNEHPKVDYEKVNELKFDFVKRLFQEQQNTFLKSKGFANFFKQNEHWLKAYAAFCVLRDTEGTADFTQWKAYSQVTPQQIDEITSANSVHYQDVALYYFIQYHLDHQLKEAVNYARSKGVTIKGDLPIGVYRYGVDAWHLPHLFNMNGQSGAPPDHYSISGQNWGFPTYNWEEMAKDNFLWWRQRLQKLAEYFDTYRIDHILGFFRIWEIPLHQVEGLLGKFNPSLSMGVEELRHWGLNFDYDRFCKPYIREHMLPAIFGDLATHVRTKYLNEVFPGGYLPKEQTNTQQKVKELIETEHSLNAEQRDRLKFGMYQLIGNVLFFEAPFSNGSAFDPRIGLHSTYSYQELPDSDKQALDAIYTHYYYKRHNEFWRNKAMEKLPALKAATDMLICGEDLGMVPESVPGVMEELDILSLEVHAMSKDAEKEFNHPADNPYMSVSTTSTHDSSTLRGWWEEDPEGAQRYFNTYLGQQGEAPFYCEPWIARDIVNQHMHAPSMLAIFPIQDLLAMDGYLRFENPHEERINVPAISQHYWRYRMHLSIEELQKAEAFNALLRNLTSESGRA